MHGPHWVEFSNRRIRSCKASAGLLLLTFWWYWSSVRAGIWGPWRDNSWKVCKKLFYQFRYLRSKKSQDQIMVFRTTPNFVLYVFISFLFFPFLSFSSFWLLDIWLGLDDWQEMNIITNAKAKLSRIQVHPLGITLWLLPGCFSVLSKHCSDIKHTEFSMRNLSVDKQHREKRKIFDRSRDAAVINSISTIEPLQLHRNGD